MGVRLVVSVSRPEEELERLALLLAEAMRNQELHERQWREYEAAAARERQKADGLREVLEKVKAGTYVSQRRMDPYSTYDPAMIFAEMEQADAREDEFLEMAADFRRKMTEAQEQQSEVTAKITTVRAQMKRG